MGRDLDYYTSSTFGYSPFYNNQYIENVTFTNKPTEIFENEFAGCTSLKSVKIGEGMKTIGVQAFKGCSSLESVTLGKNVQTINDKAFAECTAITSLYVENETPPTCISQAITDIDKWNCTLFVYQQAKDAYRAADQWNLFFDVQDIIAAESLVIDKPSLGLPVGGKEQLSVEIIPSNVVDSSISWSSSNKNVATISANGEVEAIAEGMAVITATSKNGKSTTCVVTVSSLEIASPTDYIFNISERDYAISEDENIVISMDNKEKVYSFQCDIYLPKGVTIDSEDDVFNVSLNDARTTENHILSVTPQEDGAYRIMCYSSPITVLNGTSGDLISIPVIINCKEGDYSIRIENVTIVTSDDNAAKGMRKMTMCSNVYSFKVRSIVNPVSITMSQTDLKLLLGEEASLTAIISPTNATYKNLLWSTNDETTVKLSQTGDLTAMALGDAIVNAKTVNGLSAECVVKVIERSDANGDGRISLVDLSYVVSCIMNTPAYGVVPKAADVDGDGTVDVYDLTLLCQQLIGSSSSSAKRFISKQKNIVNQQEEQNTIHIAEIKGNALSLTLDVACNYVDCQFDITLPDGMEINEAMSSDDVHKAFVSQINDNTWRVISYSSKNATYINDNIMTINIEQLNYESSPHDVLLIDNVILVKACNEGFEEYNAPGSKYNFGETTGIDNTNFDIANDKYCNLKGQRIIRNSNGIYVTKNRKSLYKRK